MNATATHLLPVVLHHGLFGTDEIKLGPAKVGYFRRIDRAIIDRGHPLIVTRVHPTSTIAYRARELKESILRQLQVQGLEEQKVILFAHSMGGLDARYMVARLGMADRVAALVTVTTPHRGSPVADWVIHNLGRKLGGAKLVRKLGWDLRAGLDLTTDRCAAFNEKIKDVPGVRYFSVSAARPWHKIPPFLLHTHRLITAAEGDNDGLVSVKSSTWGTHLGVWPADHWHTINRRYVMEFSNATGDIAPYWVRALEQVVSHLNG